MNNLIFFFFYDMAHRSLFLDKFIIFCAQTLPYLVIFLAIIFLLFHHEIFSKEKPFHALAQKWKEITFVSFSVVFAWLLSIALKLFFKVPRPFLDLHNVSPLLRPADFSFPSGHSAFFMALAVAIFLYHKKIGYVFITFALLIGISRIIAGVHYPLDILGGFLFGGLVSYLLIKSFKK
ncbi:MAG: phosphatase PAP2 family protein [bacterium]